MNAMTSRLATGLLIAAGLSVLAAPRAHAAAYATGGSGQYRAEILWLTWGGGVNGTDGVLLSNGDTTSATIPVTATQDLMLTCSLSNIGGSIESYRPGGWEGDGLDDLYNIGGTDGTNQLIAGIMGREGDHTFTISCQATLGGQPYRIPGLVMADAESLEDATGDEFLQGTAYGLWNVVEMNAGNGNPYIAEKSLGGDGRHTLRFGPGGQAFGSTSPGGVTFLTFEPAAYGPGESISMDFVIRGGGNTAIAIGLLAPGADFGDAPGSYGDASHVIQALEAQPDGLQVGQSANVNDPAFQMGGLLPPASGFLGTTGPDGEQDSQPGADALGDDNNGTAGAQEEDAWQDDVLVLTSATTLSRAIACNGSGTVAGWIDFNRNGAFDPGERAAAACAGGSAALTWNVPADVEGGDSFVRLRYSSDAGAVASATGEAPDGEVEDHAVELQLGVDVSLVKAVTPTTAAIGQQVTYTLTVGNAGPFAADGSVVTDPPVAGLDCPAADIVDCDTDGGAQCPTTLNTVGDLRGPAGLTIPVLPVGGEVVLSFTCTVEDTTP